VTIFNVLYHQWVKSETKVIEQIFKLLKPGGYLLLTEPAFDFLFRNHDLLDMGRKRYTLGEFKKILENSGFQIVKATYFNSICFIPALLLKLIESLKPPKKQHFGANELNIPSPLINKMFLTIISWERQIINLLVSLPFGVTLLCLAQKPEKIKKS